MKKNYESMKNSFALIILISGFLIAPVWGQNDVAGTDVSSDKKEYVIPETLLNQVEQGNAEVAYFIATTLFEETDNIRSDQKRGMEWLKKAAEMEEPHAMYELAMHYHDEDKQELALDWLTKAADKQLPSAIEMLATYHYKGYANLDKNCQKAYHYFELAQSKQDEMAYNNHAWMLATSKDENCRNPEKALKIIYELLSIYGNEPVPWFVLDTQSAVLAAVSDFGRAIKLQQMIIEEMEEQKQNTEIYQEHLRLYKQRKALWIEE